MADEEKAIPTAEPSTTDTKAPEKTVTKERREIKGNLPYTAYPGSLKSVLDGILIAERPEKFSTNYLETVLKMSGGGARSVPPFLKKMGFLEGDGAPTDRYSRFKTEAKRGQAAYEGLRLAFGELFKRNEHADKATEQQIKDIVVEVTGLNKSDQIVRLIYTTFDTVRSYIKGSVTTSSAADIEFDGSGKANFHETEKEGLESGANSDFSIKRLGISYQINIVLPESDNPMVFDAIFKSLRRNLL